MKTNTFRINSQNIEEALGIQVTFVMEIQPQKELFLAQDCFLGGLHVHFEPLLGWELTFVCHNLRTVKEDIYSKWSEYQTSNWHTSDLYQGKKSSNRRFYNKNLTAFLETYESYLNSYQDENVLMYATIKKLKQTEYKIYNYNIKQATGIPVRFVSEINFQKESILAKYDFFTADLASILRPCQDRNIHKYSTT